MDMLINKSSIYDPKCTLEAKTVTFEGLEVYSKHEELQNKGFIFESLSKAMWQIYNHIKRNTDTQILDGMFYFKINDKEQAVLLYATCIKTDRSSPVLNSELCLGLLANELKYKHNR